MSRLRCADPAHRLCGKRSKLLRELSDRRPIVCGSVAVTPAQAGLAAHPRAAREEEMNARIPAILFVVCLTCSLAASAQQLRWGGDAEGGAPYVEADPTDPGRVVGFDVEVAQLLASGLGRTPRFIQVGFTSIDAEAARGDFDVGLSGIEDSSARRARLAVTKLVVWEFREVLTVRAADAGKYRSLADLRGRRVA